MSVYDRILITGGGGMLAKAFVKTLRSRSYEPNALDRASLDITDAEALSAELRRIKPSLVLNCAAYTKVDLCEDPESVADMINGDAPALLAIYAWEQGAKLIHF